MGRPRVLTDEERITHRKATGQRCAEKARQDPERSAKRKAYLKRWWAIPGGYWERLRGSLAYKERKKEITRKHRFQRVYGISVEERNALLLKQGGKCPGCDTVLSLSPNPPERRACVDHDHQTGVVRGILCFRCNCAEGLLCSDPVRMRRLADYIESAPRKEVL